MAEQGNKIDLEPGINRLLDLIKETLGQLLDAICLYGDENRNGLIFSNGAPPRRGGGARMAFLKDYSGLAVGEEFMGQIHNCTKTLLKEDKKITEQNFL